MDEISTDAHVSAVDVITPAGDFRAANKRRSLDLDRVRRIKPGDTAAQPDDEVVLSAVANVSLRDELGMSTSAIAADLGLTPAEVSTDLAIAAEICHPSAH